MHILTAQVLVPTAECGTSATARQKWSYEILKNFSLVPSNKHTRAYDFTPGPIPPSRTSRKALGKSLL
jgi:hypothetical protein